MSVENFIAIHRRDVEIFHWIRETFTCWWNDRKSQQSQYDLSASDHACLYRIVLVIELLQS